MKLALILLLALVLLVVLAIGIFVFVIQDVETPAYGVVDQDGPFEIRDYPALIVAEATRQGSRQAALRGGFGTLARYIFARERTGERIAMTAPVTQQRRESIAMTTPVTQTQGLGGDWTVRFVMPARYRLDQLPAPASNDIRFQEMPARWTATVRFSGTVTDETMAAQEAALRAWLAGRGLTAAGPATYAYYNDPFTPPFLRRYEVILDIAPATSGSGPVTAVQ